MSFVLPSRQTAPLPAGAVDRAEERMLVDESVDGTAGGVMLLDTESAQSDERQLADRTEKRTAGTEDGHGRHRPSPRRVPVRELLPAWR